MSPSFLLKMENIGKQFRVLRVQKTLFRLGLSLSQGEKLQRELWALRDISLEINAGEKVAVVGLNGAGKTTFFRIASGILSPTEGRLQRRAALVPHFSYRIGMNPHLSVLDNIYLLAAFYGILAREIEPLIPEILTFSDLADFLSVPVRLLSTGQIQRLAFAVFIQNHHSFLAFDENPVVGDLIFQKRSGHYFNQLMHDPDKTVLIASHSMELLTRLCRRGLWLHEGRLQMDGPVQQVAKAYQTFCDEHSPLSSAGTAV